MQETGLKILVTGSLIIGLVIAIGCQQDGQEREMPDFNKELELDARLEMSGFSLVHNDRDAVDASWTVLDGGNIIPDLLEVEFAGEGVRISKPDPSEAIGISHTNGRLSVVYPLDSSEFPTFGDLVPIAMAHYVIPENETDILLLMLSFQVDKDESNIGVGLKTINMEGKEMSAPFAVAMEPEKLSGKFFFDEFLAGDQTHDVAARNEWDQGILLITKLSGTSILSTYLPWY